MPKTKEKAPADCSPAGAKVGDRFHPGHVKPIKKESGLQEKSSNTLEELKKRFTPRKEESADLSEVYYRLYTNEELNKDEWLRRALRVQECGTLLDFAHPLEDGKISTKGTLVNANFCKDRLCSMCSWRRSRKIFGQVSRVMERISGKYMFLFLTLTVRNVSAECLSETLNRLNSAFNQLMRQKPVKKVVKGYFRALEVTYSKPLDNYHPHFHCVLAVPKGYLAHGDYISRDKWLDLWRKCYKDDSITQVDIRVCRNKNISADELQASSALASAVAEVAKYAVKLELDRMSDDVIKTLALCLKGRRLAVFGLAFRKTFIELGLDDAEAESADLIHLDGRLDPNLAYVITRYQWTCGVYKMSGVKTMERLPDAKAQ